MVDEEDDYLSDKFLLETAPAPSGLSTYAERRKEAQRLAALKNEQNKKKSKRQLELESREEGLRKSLFERAKDEEAAGQQNKALAMMMKMGFKPGQSLGQKYDEPSSSASGSQAGGTDDAAEAEQGPAIGLKRGLQHRAEPLPLNEWTGMYYNSIFPYVLMRPNFQARKASAWANALLRRAHPSAWPKWPRWRSRQTIRLSATASVKSTRNGGHRAASRPPSALAPTWTRKQT